MMMMAIQVCTLHDRVRTAMLPKLVQKITRILIMSATMTPKMAYRKVHQTSPQQPRLIRNNI